MTTIESLVRSRGGLKAQLSVVKKHFDKLADEYPDLILAPNDENLLKRYLERIKQIEAKLDDVQSKIEEIVDENDLVKQYTERDTFCSELDRYISSMSTMLDATKKATEQTTTTRPAPTTGLQLPAINLPKFNGDPEHWIGFRDTFESLIHNRNDISEIQKFHYLKSSLGASLPEIFENLQFSSVNYQEAWISLCDRFNDVNLLAEVHLRAIIHISQMKQESSTSIHRVVDTILNRLKALKGLGFPTEHWGAIMKFIMEEKLHPTTREKWDEAKCAFRNPIFEDLLDFLKARANILQAKEIGQSNKPSKSTAEARNMRAFVVSKFPNCTYCDISGHQNFACTQFMKLNLKERMQHVNQKKLCSNCLRVGHIARSCLSTSCRICNQRHHTLLHEEAETPSTEAIDTENVTLTSHTNSPASQVLLSTISVKVLDRSKRTHIVRALLDVGSQSSFITHDLSETLNLTRRPIRIKISGLNETHSEIKERCTVEVFSNTTKYATHLDCLIVPRITGLLPNFKVDTSNLNIPSNIKLADPDYHTPGTIDILIGADIFYEVLCIGQIRLASAGPILQQTRFGWVFGGPMPGKTPNVVQCHLTKQTDLERQIARFWEIEEFPDTKPLSKEEEDAESHFITHTTRNDVGQFIVRIPLKTEPKVLGESRNTAVKRFLSLERKLMKNPEFSTLYRKFMREYRELGHMVKVINDINDLEPCYYMPHHGILKQNSSSTKLRVVFDSSCPTSSGYSFNDIQMVGPTIQSDLCTILMRFRKHQYAIVADIEKMYRMCIVDSQQISLQRIIWRDTPDDPLDTYELITVTYGTSAAPFLAIRCLHQLAIECKDLTIAEIMKNDFYVDDLLSGASTITEATHIAETIKGVLAEGGFKLCKFTSNSPLVLQNLTLHNNASTVDLGANENAQTLGMIWNAREDCFLYKFRTEFTNRVTKRTVLSESSQIFDPLGLLSPTTVVSKLILRDMWLEKLEWDSPLPLDIYTRWSEFRRDLEYIRTLNIPRTITCRNPNRLEAHVFSDASTRAYGACLYLKSVNQTGGCAVKLLCAKSKVCPLKPQTVPRLELLAALLACRLMQRTIAALKVEIEATYYWTDSSVVLGWIRTSPNLLQVFVANRIAEIQRLSQNGKWRHVPTHDNPADIISRGIRPRDLEGFELYWAGPRWLCEENHMWPAIVEYPEQLPDLKKVVFTHQATTTNLEIFERFSSLSRLERVVAYLVRFCKNCRKRQNNEEITSGPLTHLELQDASMRLARLSQQILFRNEIQSLSSNNSLEKSNPLSKWHPFLDADGIIRVGGRLSNSTLPYGKRHPILLSDKSRYARLLFSKEHERLLHAGPSLLLAHTRNRFWTLRGRNLARKTVHNCLPCFRQRPTNLTPLMGSLPTSRVQPAPPFHTTGVDYAGPFRVKDRQGRGCQVTKAYICVFVCFVTHAIHIELASDLTSECFIAAFRRFVSRRGKPVQVYSDNGTNFIGAHTELNRMKTFLQTNEHGLKQLFENENVPWSFIPPHSPHFGGLWEAGVKSAKHHLVRVAGNAILTFQQLYTLLVQIEAVLNSRPMYPLSSDPSDLQPITPAHFLIGRALTALPDECLFNFAESRLKLYQRIQQLLQQFWSRWYHEYIAELQHRGKWTTKQDNLQIDDLVIIKEDNLPPLRWALGRVTDVHQGRDGVVRVVTVRTKGGTIKRPVVKLCRLPKEEGVEALQPQSSNGGSMSRPSA